MSHRRLIEVAFPLRQASLDSVHEKNIRSGNLSTLHIWPARRPLAASRACLLATLLPDPPSDQERRDLLLRIGGRVVAVKKKGKVTEETEGGVLCWGRERSPELRGLRDSISAACGGRPPRVLDPFSGGGAIPLEAMRLGCEAIAADLNPVAWFLLKCTLQYPQQLSGEVLPIPAHVRANDEFRRVWTKTKSKSKSASSSPRAGKRKHSKQLGIPGNDEVGAVDLTWHVQAWGLRVLEAVERQLNIYYPHYVELRDKTGEADAHEIKLVPCGQSVDQVLTERNAELKQESKGELLDRHWVDAPATAYLWARTVPCKRCGAEIPLLKTRWLSREAESRCLLMLSVIEDGAASGGKRVAFSIRKHVPVSKGSRSERIAKDKELGRGTMSRAGTVCPCCQAPMTMEDIRLRAKNGQLAATMTAVMVEGPATREFRLPRQEEVAATLISEDVVLANFAEVPYGLPTEPTPKGGMGASRAFSVDGYGLDQWHKLFTRRQLVSLATFVKVIRGVAKELEASGYPESWKEAVYAYLAVALDRTANYMSTICIWESKAREVKQTFLRYALPITWDFAEANPLAPVDRYFRGGLSNIVKALRNLLIAGAGAPPPTVVLRSAVKPQGAPVDLVVTDPPYYDAIPYSDLMDFFYVWLRRVLSGYSAEFDEAFAERTGPKWDAEENDGELIDDASRHENSAEKSRWTYEEGMCRAFISAHNALSPDGRLVVVFANKQPDAWGALVSAIIRAGFVVCGSWPIVTEMRGGVRNYGRASLASSVWLVCRKRPASARAGFDSTVLDEMRGNINERLRRFWDDGIRGPDFVWAATGPALEAYSKHPVVKKADSPGEIMSVNEFLSHARRLVVEFVVGRVLSPAGDDQLATTLDPVTTYWLLHRQAFQMEAVPIGPCILYAISCGVSDRELVDTWDILQSKESGESSDASSIGDGGDDGDEMEDTGDGDSESEASEDSSASGSKVRLKPWNRRTRKGLGESPPSGKQVPMIDVVHRCMQLWTKGEIADLDRYMKTRGLGLDSSFHHVLQATIELAPRGSGERELLEALSNYLGVQQPAAKQEPLPLEQEQ